MDFKLFIKFVKFSRPAWLLVLLMQYILGFSFSKYYGGLFIPDRMGLGLAWLISLYLGLIYLLTYFENLEIIVSDFWGDEIGKVPIQLSLITSAVFLTTSTLLALSIVRTNLLFPSNVMIVILLVIIGLLFVFTPNIESLAGFREYFIAIWFGMLVPSFSYLLYFSNLNYVIVIVWIPLVFLFLSITIINQLSSYARDLKFSANTLVIKIGWERSIVLNNLFLLSAFLCYGVGWWLGVESRIIISALLPLPLALTQIWMLIQLANGAKPNWTILKNNSAAIFGLMNYMIIISIWTQ